MRPDVTRCDRRLVSIIYRRREKAPRFNRSLPNAANGFASATCEFNLNQIERASMKITDPKFVTVVSGLPRSGTSMMMQMLEAGGMPVITDNVRAADHDNPRGYYEFEPVKQLSKDTSWLNAAGNKAVKVIYRLLYDLPRNHRYKVILMRRKLEETIASQNAMLRRLNKEGGSLADDLLAHAYQRELQKLDIWLRGRGNFEVLYVNYDYVVYDSRTTVADIEQFLHCKLDTEAMIGVIDQSLHRKRVGSVHTTV
jgi:hypothetical protein